MKSRLLNASFIFLALVSSRAWATDAPCGILQEYEGNIQILEKDRSRLIGITKNAALPCGGWILVNEGWTKIKYKTSTVIHAGENSLLQLNRGQEVDAPEQITLYSGQIYIDHGSDGGKISVVSPVARLKLQAGKVIFHSDRNIASSELIVLENIATLENRFDPAHSIKVGTGEMSDLNFRLVRVTPSTPRAISVASLGPRLSELRVDPSVQYEILSRASAREERKFAANLENPESSSRKNDEKLLTESNPENRSIKGRALASQPEAEKAAHRSEDSYARTLPDKSDAELKEHWMKKMVGGEISGSVSGELLGQQVLFPDQFYGRGQRIELEIEDPETKSKSKAHKQEEAEKKRLIDELSKVRNE